MRSDRRHCKTAGRLSRLLTQRKASSFFMFVDISVGIHVRSMPEIPNVAKKGGFSSFAAASNRIRTIPSWLDSTTSCSYNSTRSNASRRSFSSSSSPDSAVLHYWVFCKLSTSKVDCRTILGAGTWTSWLPKPQLQTSMWYHLPKNTPANSHLQAPCRHVGKQRCGLLDEV